MRTTVHAHDAARLEARTIETATPIFAAPLALGCAVALLAYSVFQLAHAAGYPLVRVEPGAIPLFVRWRACALIGSLAAVPASASGARQFVAQLAAWVTMIACAAVALVVIVAP
jgi:hypothetical protein